MESTIMQNDLEQFLQPLTSASTQKAIWRGGQIHLDLDCYLTELDPPDSLVTSARCIVLAGDSVLVMSNPSGEHILPGGRREPGESPEEAMIRELREETGLIIQPSIRLAIMHFHHTTPKPPLYAYPYPDFLQIISVVRLEHPEPVTVRDTYEMSGEYVALSHLDSNRIPPEQHLLLQRATQLADLTSLTL
jgi:8-oxo-dGTP pyrophosphatase MutT (NUDIX family)